MVAEIGSAFLCAHTGISKPELETNTTAYLQSWIETLKGDPRLIVSAAAQAQRAVDMILGTQPEEQFQDSEAPAFPPHPPQHPPQELCA
jgi:antirestriction protein ArdC